MACGLGGGAVDTEKKRFSPAGNERLIGMTPRKDPSTPYLGREIWLRGKTAFSRGMSTLSSEGPIFFHSFSRFNGKQANQSRQNRVIFRVARDKRSLANAAVVIRDETAKKLVKFPQRTSSSCCWRLYIRTRTSEAKTSENKEDVFRAAWLHVWSITPSPPQLPAVRLLQSLGWFLFFCGSYRSLVFIALVIVSVRIWWPRVDRDFWAPCHSQTSVAWVLNC